jgi:hypothetical protein
MRPDRVSSEQIPQFIAKCCIKSCSQNQRMIEFRRKLQITSYSFAFVLSATAVMHGQHEVVERSPIRHPCKTVQLIFQELISGLKFYHLQLMQIKHKNKRTFTFFFWLNFSLPKMYLVCASQRKSGISTWEPLSMWPMCDLVLEYVNLLYLLIHIFGE